MNANPQWDISRTLGVARLFQLVCGVRDACVTPFLTLYLRQLGLAAPWVGILMGTGPPSGPYCFEIQFWLIRLCFPGNCLFQNIFQTNFWKTILA